MEIRVESDHWGEGRSGDIEALLRNVASHLTRYLRESIGGTIIVLPTASTEDDPITCYRATPEEPYVILLQARDKRWSKFSYQFAHEFCHVLSGYERLNGNPNGWFHEALCELAAVFALLGMAESWTTHPPFPHWNRYAPHLREYANELLVRPERQLLQEFSLARWLSIQENSLRQDRYQRDKNAIVAYTLLPLFRNEPTGWNVVSRLPPASAMFHDYLCEWYALVEEIDKPFLTLVLAAFELRW